MSSTHRQGFAALPTGLLAASVFGAGILFASTVRVMSTRPAAHDRTIISVTPASTSDIQGLGAQAVSPAIHSRIDVDATRRGAPNPDLLRSICSVSRSPDSPTAPGQSAALTSPPESNEATKWARLDSAPAPVSRPAAPADSLDVYAVRSQDGATVCIANRAASDAEVQVNARLAKAPYAVECLEYHRPQSAERGKISIEQGMAANAASSDGWKLTRLKGRDLSAAGVVSAPIRVRPGGVSFLRFTDTAYASRCALDAMRSLLKRLPRASSDLSQRLHVILDGADNCEKAISATSTLSADARRSSIHRYLLVLGQVYALHRNFQVNNQIAAGPGVEFRASLDRLNDALADTSATLMGLVPGITIAAEPPTEIRTASANQADGAARQDIAHSAYATVTLSNQGSVTADHVKVGLDRSSLPEGVLCEPADPAFFGSLAPNQTVRAIYLLRWNGASFTSRGLCSGDVSYFTAGAPAHLRPRLW